jgi:hypothetical protein
MIERSESSRGSATVGFVLGFVVASLIAAVVVWRLGWPASERPLIDTSRPTVIRQIQQLQRLETTVFGMDKIVAGGRDSRYLPQFLAGDRLLLIVYGEVTAGVDVGLVDAEHVIVSARTIQMTLPEPEIFATRIDNDRTRVYSRETGLLTRVDPNLESDVRREAERQIRQAALDNGILEVARRNARTTMASFLRGLGFEQAEVR